MRLNHWFRHFIVRSEAQWTRRSLAASRERQRLVLRRWLFEPLEDRALLAGLSGLHTIGPTGGFSSIGAAIASIQSNGLDGPLTLELQKTYVSNVESFPLSFSSLGTTSVNTITLRPELNATNLLIASNNTTAATVDLNDAQYLTIDGRPGGIGSSSGSGAGAASQLTIENTSTAGIALRFIKESSNNTIQYTKFRGVNTSVGSGTIVFGATTGANGNDNNTIDHCDIGSGVSTPTNGIFSSGSTATVATHNSNNTISNNNIFNFYVAIGLDSAGVSIQGGNTDWTIAGNSLYQTVSRTPVAANVRAIYINSSSINFSSGSNFKVTDNFIGGSSPNAGGSSWTVNGTSSPYAFVGIHINSASGIANSVQGNTIRNFIWTSSSSSIAVPGVWSGIYVAQGNANIGTAKGNEIGSGTGTGSISVTTSGSGGASFGISSNTSGVVSIVGNTIGSMVVNGSNAGVSASLFGIQVNSGTVTIDSNLVGSATTANSLNASTQSTSLIGQQVVGISSKSHANITRNTVANLNNNFITESNGPPFIDVATYGIQTKDGKNTVTGNTVRNISAAHRFGAGPRYPLAGINASSKVSGQTVSQNTVHSITNTAPASVSSILIAGIFFDGSSSSTNVIARNLVHSLAFTNAVVGFVTGIVLEAGSFTVRNNMVRLGLNADGTNIATTTGVVGIDDSSGGSTRNYFHNSVYIGGLSSGDTTSGHGSSAFSSEGNGTGTGLVIQNNIFVNARSNISGSRKHYAISYLDLVFFKAGNSGGNLYFVSGAGGILGGTLTNDFYTLAQWQYGVNQDHTSGVGDPRFVNPTGTAATLDLHLQASNPAEGAGVPLAVASATVTDDFDGQVRSTLTPIDVGADAGNFTSSGDLFGPNISYTQLTNGTTANRVLTNWATITDNVGVATGANAPRLYFKKSTDANVFNVPNNSTGNGWKYVTATGSGPYSFTINYSIINGGIVLPGSTIQYFVVAQDAANNYSSNKTSAEASVNPPVQNISSTLDWFTYKIVNNNIFSGVKTVGRTGDYPDFTSTNGLFAAINNGVLTGDLVVNVISDLTEPGDVSLNEFNSNNYPAPNPYSITIRPDSGTMRTISGSAANGLIKLDGADRVVIDGRFGGSGRYLTFRNTHPAGGGRSTISFENDASNNVLRNSVIQGTSESVVEFLGGHLTGNDNNLVTENSVSNIGMDSSAPSYLVRSFNDSDAMNSGNTVSNNELFNFNSSAIDIEGDGNEAWTLSRNEVFQAITATLPTPSGPLTGISMRGGHSHVISNNYIHDFRTTHAESIGVSVFDMNASSVTTVSNNLVTAFNMNSSTASFTGVYADESQGMLDVINNQIVINPSTSASRSLRGIVDGSNSSAVNLFYNSVVIDGTESSMANSWASLRLGSSASTARNNIFLNLRTGGSGNHFAVGNESSGGSYTVGNNVYAGTGITPANFMGIGNISNSAVPMSFAAWQILTGDSNSQGGVAGVGNFTSAMFVDASRGNLRLVSGGNSLVNGQGIPIAGVTTDIDGDLRNPIAPDIGADERDLTAPSIIGVFAAGSTWSSAFIDAVDGGGMGAGNGLGYTLSSGLTLPNAGIDRIYVQFSEPVVGFNASTVALLGVDVADYASVPGLMSVSYDSANRRGVIELSSSLVRDKLRLGVSDAVKDLSLNALDGDANASAGGAFDLRFNVLVGDANNDGSINGGDLPFFATAFNTSTGSTSYNPRADWNANGSVNGGDLPLFAARFNQSLPTAEPAALGFPPAMLPQMDSASMLAPPIEEIEAFFSQLDERHLDDEDMLF